MSVALRLRNPGIDVGKGVAGVEGRGMGTPGQQGLANHAEEIDTILEAVGAVCG